MRTILTPRDRIEELERTLSEAYGHLVHGSASPQAQEWMAGKIKRVLGWNAEQEVAQKIEHLQHWANK